ncbi:uncharacterized protein LOC132024218 [Mustela nigripes]|uniref:uncharacterized protein LOC132024218 n=1 Tax=Mustela nigripes TaxID=77151 RepID=UPI0028154C13|nr:uncharacterized protein LOC132024218 [Mustela nigripes]
MEPSTHKLVYRLSGTPRNTLPAGKGRDSPPGGVGSAAGGPGRLRLPAPPLHPAQATPPTRPSAGNATVAETRSSCPLPQRPRPSYLGVASGSDPPTSPQLPGPPPRCSALSPPPRLLSSVERGSYALYRPDSPTLWSPGQSCGTSPEGAHLLPAQLSWLPFS